MGNGFTGILMEASVQAVPEVFRTKKEKRQMINYDLRKKDSSDLFANILEGKMQEKQQEEIMDCRSTTYGRDSRMQTFLYQTREYRY